MALTFRAGRSLADFQADEILQSAVPYQITIIGEAARRISPAFRSDHSEFPWSRMIALRNVVVHEYARVELERIWNLLSGDLPEVLDRGDMLTRDVDE